MNYNKTILCGHIVRDAVLKQTDSGYAIGKFSLAVNRNYKKNNEWETETLFIDANIFGDAATRAVPKLKQGVNAFAEGYLKLDKWTDKEGNTRSKIEFIVQRVHTLPPKVNNEDDEAVQLLSNIAKVGATSDELQTANLPEGDMPF